MTHSPSGGWTTRDVNEWVMGQAQYLSPTQTLVLWYLAANAWLSECEEGKEGEVMSGRTPTTKIMMRTGLGERTVRDALRALQDEGYIIADMQRGNGKSTITVFWDPAMDVIREEYRAGVRSLPKYFQRQEKEPVAKLQTVTEATILKFPNRQ